MSLSPITSPAVEPVSLDEVKRHLRVSGTDEDGVIAALIAAATRAVETATDRALIVRRMRLRLDAPPADGIVTFPLSPLQSVEAVRIRDRTGGSVSVPLADLRVDAASDPPRLTTAGTWPSPDTPFGGIEIDFTAGYGPTPAAVPEPLRLAVRMLAARWFERRGDDEPGRGPISGDVAALIAPFRRPRLA